MNRLCSLLCVCACLIGLNVALWGQSAPTVSGIRGYLDPRTGIFHSLAQMTPQDEEPGYEHVRRQVCLQLHHHDQLDDLDLGEDWLRRQCHS